jgi:16S rRNA (guanine966-N2)-methyltransferase
VRIIAGRLRGRRLDAPTWPGLRPTSDKLRETLFNVLQHEVGGARVLDGFAGTGAVGLEALSRGAAHVTFVERDPRACSLIGDNLRRCGVMEGYTIVRSAFPGPVARAGGPFDLIVVDPPYDEPDLAAIVSAGAQRLTETGVLVLEHAARREQPEAAGGVSRLRVLTSGDSALAFYRRAVPGIHS